MLIKMELLTDVIFGNGMSVPGAEDTSVLHDEYGFPYYKGTTFKGILREEYERYLQWCGEDSKKIAEETDELFGANGDIMKEGKLIFSDFHMSDYVKKMVFDQMQSDGALGNACAYRVLDLLTNIRTFTKITKDGVVQTGSLRMVRCVNKGLCLYSEVVCQKEQEKVIKEVIESIKWIGSMRNRGFGKVKLTIEEDSE